METGNIIRGLRQQRPGLNQKKLALELGYAQSTICDKEFVPLCGSPLVLRHGKYGDFYGCSSYPKCKFRHNIDS